MSIRWKLVSGLSILVAVILIVLGYVIPRFLPFTENILTEAAGLLMGFGIAFLLIEGRALTREARQRRILVRTAISITQEAAEIGQVLTREIATSLSTELELSVDLEDEDVGDNWNTDVIPMLCKIYDEAEAVGDEQIKYEVGLPYERYRSRIFGIKDYSQRIRTRFEANLEVHESLLELSEAFDSLDQTLNQCLWPSFIRTDVDRYRSTGCIGNALVRLVDTIGTIHCRFDKLKG